jgi:protocatechuate 3,4-dioxygenase beta subunit
MSRTPTPWLGRRQFVAGTAVGLFLPHAARAATGPVPTPRQTEGPYYPVEWQGDIDNDLVVVRGEAARAIGTVVHVHGRVLGADGQPARNARVEIWQCDAQGIYRHPSDERGGRRRDAGFQGRGRTVADGEGRYSFRTIRPVAYAGRTPHIHFRVDAAEQRSLVTQMYLHGEPQNARDFVFNNIRDARQRDSVLVRLDPADRLEAGALAGTFDIVLG